MDIFNSDYINDESIYQEEINIGFFNLDKEKFDNIIKGLCQSSFSKNFSLKENILNYNEYTLATFEEKKEIKNEIIDEEDIDEDKKGLIIKINNCKFDENKDENYDEFIKEKLDFYFIFNEKILKENFMYKIQEYSKLNYIIITLGKDINDKFNDSDYIYDYFIISQEEKNKYDEASKILIFDDFLSEMKKKFDLYKIFQKYSIEKNIISFKDYLYNFNKYDKIDNEEQLIEIFNKFERLSYNNDYADVTIILLQIIMNKKNIFISDFTFNVKSLKCGFCFAILSESEFDDTHKCFLCHRCKYAKSNYPGLKINSEANDTLK